MTSPSDALIHRLRQVTGLDDATARAVLAEVLDALDADLDTFVARRHLELQRQGLANEAIYARIREEVAGWRFTAPDLTERQIRRRIYGG